MDATLKLTNNTLAYADLGVTSNPFKRFVDWSIQRSYLVKNPKAEPFTIDPGATLSLFSGIRVTGIDNTTDFLLTISPLSGVRYRFTRDAGTAPSLRTDRALALNTLTVTVTANANATVSMTTNPGTFSAVVVGDTVFLPNTDTGDAVSPFSPLNTGYWTVLSVAVGGASVQLARPTGVSFSGTTEVVVVGANIQVQAFSAAGVQVGDKVTISAGFVASVLNTYVVEAVNPFWFEVIATQPLPTAVTGTPTTSGIQFYTSARRYVRFEADQEAIVQLNGDVQGSRLSPWAPADSENTAFMELVGPVWSASVVNKSSAPLNLLFISCE